MNEKIFKANDYGAKPDAQLLCTGAIQAAVDAAAAAGGGRVTFGKGSYRTGTVFIKSNVDFEIPEGVELLGAIDDSQYPQLRNRVAGIEMVWPVGLLTVFAQDNVHISGGGVIDGQGDYWWLKYWGADRHGGMRGVYDGRGLRWATDYDCRRPRNVVIFNSSRVTVEDLTIRRSPFWNVHVCYSDRVQVRGLKITDNFGPSTDGVDIDSSSNVTVENCAIACRDDNICIKSGRDADGLRVARPCEHVRVRNCEIGAGDGVTLGSETSGGMRDIEITGMRMKGTKNGIRLKSARNRGGLMEDIRFSDFEMTDVPNVFNFQLNWNPNYSYCQIPKDYRGEIPDYWRILCQPVAPESLGIPEFRHIRISNVRARCLSCQPASRALAAGAYPEKPLRDFAFAHIDVETDTAGSVACAKDWQFCDTRFFCADGKPFILENCENLGLPAVTGQK